MKMSFYNHKSGYKKQKLKSVKEEKVVSKFKDLDT